MTTHQPTIPESRDLTAPYRALGATIQVRPAPHFRVRVVIDGSARDYLPEDLVAAPRVGDEVRAVWSEIQRRAWLVAVGPYRVPQPVASWGRWSEEQGRTLYLAARQRGRRLPHEQEVRLVGEPPLSPAQRAKRHAWIVSLGGVDVEGRQE